MDYIIINVPIFLIHRKILAITSPMLVRKSSIKGMPGNSVATLKMMKYSITDNGKKNGQCFAKVCFGRGVTVTNCGDHLENHYNTAYGFMFGS